MLYSENELNKRLKSDCGVFYFYASEEPLVHAAMHKVEKVLTADAPETTVLEGPTPAVEDIVQAAGTISFFGGRRLVIMPMVKVSAYSDKDVQELCETLESTENAVFIITSVLEEKFGKIKPGKREQKLIATCEKLGYCVQINRPNKTGLQAMVRGWAKDNETEFAPGADSELIDRCGENQFLLQCEVDKLCALANYGTITSAMVRQLGTVTLDADVFDMVKLVSAGRTEQAMRKLKTLLDLQNEPILIAGALIGNYLDVYRAGLTRKSGRGLAELARDMGYSGKWNYRLGNAEQTAAHFKKGQLEKSMRILQKLDLDLKSSRLDSGLLLQTALCELALTGKGDR